MITREQVDSYHENGFVVVEDVIDAALLSRLRDTVKEVMAGARGLTDRKSVV